MNIYLSQIYLLALDNKYTKWYIQLVQRCLTRKTPSCLIERHHILPRCFRLGGTYDKKNIVNFTIREHFIAHWLLSKMFHNLFYKRKMIRALASFMTDINITSKQLEIARSVNYQLHTNESKLKMIEAKKNEPKNIICPHCGKSGNLGNATRWHFKNCKQLPENSNKKRNVFRIGTHMTQETKQRISTSKLGKKHKI